MKGQDFLSSLWWRLPAGCGSVAVGSDPLSLHQMGAAETLGFVASAFLSA